MSQLSHYKTPDQSGEICSVELSMWTRAGLVTSTVPPSIRNPWSNKGSVHHQEKMYRIDKEIQKCNLY